MGLESNTGDSPEKMQRSDGAPQGETPGPEKWPVENEPGAPAASSGPAEHPAETAAVADAGEANATDRPPSAPQAGPSSGAAVDDEQGWPKSWIITTAILGVVAIIVIARLVGQSMKPGEHHHGPEGERALLKQEHRKGERPPEVPEKGGPPRHGDLPPPVGTVGLQLANVKFPVGQACVGTDQKVHAAGTPRSACLFEVAGSYRVEIKRDNPISEMMLEMRASRDVDAMPTISYFLIPQHSGYAWFGGSALQGSGGLASFTVRNFSGKEALFRQVRVLNNTKPALPPTEVAGASGAALSLPPGALHCLGADKALHAVSKEGSPPAACLLKVKGASMFRIELKRGASEELSVRLKTTLEGVPQMLQATLPKPAGKEDAAPQLLEGAMWPCEYMALMLQQAGKTDLPLSSVSVTARR